MNSLLALATIGPAVVIGACLAARLVRRADARRIATWQRGHTADQVLADVARWRADRRTRETRESIATCEAIYALPTIPQQRKETGQ